MPNKIPETVDDLKAEPHNPRTIGVEEFKGLLTSMQQFGDLSGIVWNSRSGHLIAGHQRLKSLKRMHGDGLKIIKKRDGRVVLQAKGGEPYPVRVVDWGSDMAMAANMVANNPATAGVFTEELINVRQRLADERPDLADALRLWEIDVDPDPFHLRDDEGVVNGDGPPEMELQPFEHYDYLLVVAQNTHEWEYLIEKLKIERVNSSPIAGKKKIGLGRAIPAKRLIAALEGG